MFFAYLNIDLKEEFNLNIKSKLRSKNNEII